MRFVLALVLALAACGGASQKPQASGPAAGGDAAPVTAAQGVAEQWRQAWETRSIEALSPLYAHDLDLVVVYQGTAYAGWTAVETYLSTALGALKDIHLTLDGVQTVALGADGAVLQADLTRELDDGAGTVTERGALTMVLRRDPATGTWSIIGEHFSYPPSVD